MKETWNEKTSSICTSSGGLQDLMQHDLCLQFFHKWTHSVPPGPEDGQSPAANQLKIFQEKNAVH